MSSTSETGTTPRAPLTAGETPSFPPRWAVLLDDAGSMDVYEVREQAEAMRHYADHVAPLVRVDYTIVDAGGAR
jgi:hypothetical protein